MKTIDTPKYKQLLNEASRLEPADQLRLLEDLAALVRRRMTSTAQHSVTELRGLGKEIWRGIDVEQYINQERDTWDG